MLYWAIAFLIIAVIAGFLGFSLAFNIAAGIAKFLFFLFLVLALIIIFMRIGKHWRQPRP